MCSTFSRVSSHFRKAALFFKSEVCWFWFTFLFWGMVICVCVPILQISAPVVVMIMRDLFGVLLRWWMVLEKKSNCSISKYRTGFLCVFPQLSSSTNHIFMGNGSTSHIKMFCCSQWVSTLWTNGAKTSLFFRKKGLDALYFYLEQKKASPQAAPLQTCVATTQEYLHLFQDMFLAVCARVSSVQSSTVYF